MKKQILLCVMILAAISMRAQYKLDTLHYAGDSRYFIDIVYLGDGFTADELDKFVDFVKSQNDQFFEKTPWQQYKSMFNVFYVKTASNVSGAGMTPDEPIDNFYGVCFGTSGVDRMPWPTKWYKVYEVLNAVKPDYDMVPIVVNSDKYGGAGGGSFICFSMEKSSIETLRHESGHSLGDLADEYWYRGRETANMTQIINPVKWERWIGENEVGVYRYSENANEEAYSWYRPHQDCLMRYLKREYCPVCREALIEKIHEHSQNLISFVPKDETVDLESEDVEFSLTLLKPEPNTLRIDWLLDGETVGHNEERFILQPGTLSRGAHELLAIIEDTTLLVRTVDHTTLHATSVSWNVNANTETGIEVLSASRNDYLVSPLPFESVLTFSNKWPQQVETRLELFNAAGALMMSSTFQDDANCSLYTAQLPSGIYLLCVYQRNKLIYKQKIVKL